MVHRVWLSLNSKCRVGTCRLQNNLFHLIYHRPLRSSCKIVFECFDADRRSFGKCFNASIRTVANVAHYLVPGGRTLRKETIPDALHLTSYEKLSRHALHVRPLLLALKKLARFSLLEGECLLV